MKISHYLIALATVFTLSACGGGGGSSTPAPGGTTVVTAAPTSGLSTALKPTLKEAPVVAVTLTRQNGTSIVGANVNLSSDSGIFTIGAANAATDASGVAGLAAAAGSYDLGVTGLPATVGTHTRTQAVSADATQFVNMQTSEFVISVTSTDLVTATVSVHQTDAGGNILNINTPNVVVSDLNVVGNSAALTLELFAGSYRFIISGTAANVATQLTTIITDNTVVAGGGTNENLTFPLDNAGNLLALTLRNSASNPLPGLTIIVVDSLTGLELARGTTDTTGTASALVATGFTDITVALVDFTSANNVGINAATGQPNTILGLYRNKSFTSDDLNTLDQVTVNGAIEPPTGSTLQAGTTSTITINATDLSPALVTQIGTSIPLDSIPNIGTTGIYNVNLFPGEYEVDATNVAGFPDSTSQAVSLLATTIINIPVAVGGVIIGRVQDQANNNLANVAVQILPDNSLTTAGALTAIATTATAADGTYQVALPFGTYDLVVGGAVTENLTLATGAETLTKDIRRLQVSGRVIDENSAGVSANVFSLFGAGAAVTASNLGLFSFNLFEGINNYCVTPPATRTTLGTECFFNISVTEAIVDAI